MRPQPQYFGNSYPLAIALGLLLLPYIWSALLFPFRISSYLSGSGKSSKVVKSSISLTTSIVKPTSTAAGFNLWKGVRGVIGPKWEAPPDKSAKSVSTKTTSKYTKQGKGSPTVSISVKTIKEVTTVTKSVTPKHAAKTVTKSITQTVEREKLVEKLVEKNGGQSDSDDSVIIEEISIMGWHQTTFTLASRSRGCYLITDEVVKSVPEIKNFKVGLLHLFIQHTSAGLTLNENWDADVRKDMIDALDKLAPEKAKYRHNAEGPDDMPAHIKSVLTGTSVSIPISGGKLALGTWQGIYLCEFRTSAHRRTLVATIQGE